MEIKNLEIILVLNSEKHFNRAAEKLNISQPALSMKLKSLENEIGVKLVKRGKNFIGLTKEGGSALHYIIIWLPASMEANLS